MVDLQESFGTLCDSYMKVSKIQNKLNCPLLNNHEGISYLVDFDKNKYTIFEEKEKDSKIYSLKFKDGKLNVLSCDGITYYIEDNKGEKFVNKYIEETRMLEQLYYSKVNPNIYEFCQENQYNKNIFSIQYEMPKSQREELFLHYLSNYSPGIYECIIRKKILGKINNDIHHLYFYTFNDDIYARNLFKILKSRRLAYPYYNREYIEQEFKSYGAKTSVPEDLIQIFLNQNEHIKKLELLCQDYNKVYKTN